LRLKLKGKIKAKNNGFRISYETGALHKKIMYLTSNKIRNLL